MHRILALAVILAAPVCFADEDIKVAQHWAVLVGVDDYAYANDLEYCGADQFALFEQLKQSGFPEENVFILHTKSTDVRYQPSRSNIERQLNLVFQLAEEKDFLLVGFSGHGVHIDGKSYLCPADAELENPDTLISLDGIYDRLNACAAPFKLVIVDACRNDPRPGGKRSFEAGAGTRALAETLHSLELPKGVVLLNSCAPGEVSWEEAQFGHGVFMHYVLEGLKGGADSSRDGRVSLNELGEFVGPKTKAYVARQFGYPQRPFFKGELSIEAMSYALLPTSVGRDSVPPTSLIPPVTPPTTVPPGGSTAASRGDARDTRFPARSDVRAGQPWLGVTLMRPMMRELVVIGALPDTAAAAAGLRRDDKILAIGDTPVQRRWEFDEALALHNAGDTIKLKILRNDQEMELPIVLDPMPPDAGTGRMLAAAEAGDLAAMIEMVFRYGGTMHDLKLCDPNPSEAYRWARRAADTGDGLGWFQVGYLSFNGIGTLPNPTEAAQAYSKALSLFESNNDRELSTLVKFNLGNLFIEGQGVGRDYARGIDMVSECAEAGHAMALSRLGYLHEEGMGVSRDYAKAMDYYMRAAKLGLPEAETNIGHLCEYGRGVRADPQNAIGWYRSAASHGEPQAMFNLGQFYERGWGVQQDYATANEWFRKAAERGHKEAKLKVR